MQVHQSATCRANLSFCILDSTRRLGMPRKRLDASTLEVMAETICGGGGGSGAAEYSAPGVYRSMSEILAFFARANAAARGQSSTRKWFVLESLQNLNQEAAGDLVPESLQKVILRLANPQEYRGDMQVTQAVMDDLNRVLSLDGLEVVLDGVRPRLREVQVGAPPQKPKSGVYEPPPDFVRLGVEPRLAEILAGRWNDAQKCVNASVHLSAMRRIGSARSARGRGGLRTRPATGSTSLMISISCSRKWTSPWMSRWIS